MQKIKDKETVVELFAGAGGLALGLEKAGFDTILITDNDLRSTETLKENRPDWNVVKADVRDISNDKIYDYIDKDTEVSLLSGGYPCQSFSYAGKGLGLSDTRGTLFYNYANLLSILKPKTFLAENVKGLLSHDGGRTLKTMIEVFEKQGYTVSYKVLSAWDYGVAQKRMRIFIVGIRNDLAKIANKDFEFPEPITPKPLLRDVLKNVPESNCTPYSDKKKIILDQVPPGGCWRDLPDAVAKEYMGKSYYLGGGKTGMARRLSWDEPSLTILCSPSQKQTERCHPDYTRPLTVRESARIQDFPDAWKFSGAISQQYKQIGNAVPVGLAHCVGKQIMKFLEEIKNNNYE